MFVACYVLFQLPDNDQSQLYQSNDNISHLPAANVQSVDDLSSENNQSQLYNNYYLPGNDQFQSTVSKTNTYIQTLKGRIIHDNK